MPTPVVQVFRGWFLVPTPAALAVRHVQNFKHYGLTAEIWVNKYATTPALVMSIARYRARLALEASTTQGQQ